MSERLLLGVDEGTTGVKAALFDESLAAGRARRAATRSTAIREEGWVEQDGEEVLEAVIEAIAELLDDPPGEVVACGLDHQGESVLAWDAESGKPLSPIVVWQDKRSQEVLDRLGDERGGGPGSSAGCPSTPTSPPPSSPGCSRTTTPSRRPATPARCGWARSTPSSATGSAPASPPTPRPPRAPSSTRSARRASTSASARSSGSRPRSCPRSATRAGELGTLSHESWPVELPLRGQVVDQQAALAGAACVVPGRVKATYGTGVFVLAHVGERGPEAGRRTAADGRLEHRRQGRVRARRRRLRRRGDARVDVQGARPGRGPAGAEQLAREAEGSAGARVLPGPGRDRRALVAPRRPRGDLGDLRRHDAAPTSPGPRSRGSPGGSPTSSPRSARPIEVDALRVDGGLTNEPLMLQLQADAIGAPGRGRRRRRHRARRRGAGRGRQRADRLARRAARSCCPPTAGSSPSATRPGARPSTSAGASSSRRPRRSTRASGAAAAAGARRSRRPSRRPRSAQARWSAGSRAAHRARPSGSSRWGKWAARGRVSKRLPGIASWACAAVRERDRVVALAPDDQGRHRRRAGRGGRGR